LLKVEPLVLVASPGHSLAHHKSATYRDLRDQTLFLPKADCGYRMIFEQIMAAERIHPSAVIELNSIEAIKKIVMSGLGVTVIPEIAVQSELKNNRLAKLAWSEILETGVCMIWHKDKWFSRALKTLMDLFREKIRGSS